MRRVLFDATRMFMRAGRGTPTGIDRVNHAYARWLLSEPEVHVTPVCAWGGVATPLSGSSLRALVERETTLEEEPSLAWKTLLAHLAGERRPGQVQRTEREPGRIARYGPVAARTLASWRPFSGPPGDIYFNVAHFGLEQTGLLRRLQARNVKSVVMIHDLIPIAHPEFCGPAASRWHARRVDAVLDHASVAITNSASTAAELVAYAGSRRTPRICVAPLGLEAPFLRPRLDMPPMPPYFVCVGTIEPRKNLTFLLTLWRRLADRMGKNAPRLVLAGRRGWENESVIDHLERSPAVVRYVHEVAGLADDELARLIGGAAALLAPTFSEGFNLPVAEALAMGTPVIASDIPVHRELARTARLIDPLDGPAWLTAIEDAVTKRLPSRPTPSLSWPDHFEIVKRALAW